MKNVCLGIELYPSFSRFSGKCIHHFSGVDATFKLVFNQSFYYGLFEAKGRNIVACIREYGAFKQWSEPVVECENTFVQVPLEIQFVAAHEAVVDALIA